jgi:antitoxin component YwqK of YwqJK toxin-antitoxin module
MKNGTYITYIGDGRKSETPFHDSTEIVENYKNGLLHGKVIHNESMVMTGEKKQVKGQKDEFIFVGTLSYECNYKNGLKDGKEIYRHYGHMGRYKEREYNYKNGLLHGKTTHWDAPPAHIKESEKNYKNDLLDGKSITWFHNREKESETNYKNGKKDGKLILWYYNKQKKSELVFKNDVLQDGSKYWYPNGKEKDEYIDKLEKQDIEEGACDIASSLYIPDFLKPEDVAEYEKNYEGYDRFGDGTIEDIHPHGDPFDEGLTDDERSLGREFWKDIY